MDALSDAVSSETASQVRLYGEVLEHARCHMMPSEACASKDLGCPYHDSAFCAWAIRAEQQQMTSGALQDAVLRESALAESLGIPRRLRWLWDIGQRGGAASRVNAQAQYQLDRTPASCCILILSGDTGNGKSVAAGGWAWRKRGHWWPAMRSYWYQPWAQETAWLLTCDRLVVDGIQREWSSKDGVHVRNLRYIITERYDNRRKTLITTDCTSSEFEDLLGRRYSDAANDDVRFVRLTEASLRDPVNRARAREFGPSDESDFPPDDPEDPDEPPFG